MLDRLRRRGILADSSAASPPESPAQRYATLTAFVTLAASLMLRAASTFIHTYAQDDFFWAYTAWLRSTSLVPNKDWYVANFTPLAELAAPLFRLFPDSFVPVNIARVVMFFVGVALVAVTYRMTRLLGASVLWALIAADVLSWQHHFVKRIGDIRSDQIAAVFLVAAVLCLLEERPRYLLCGLLLGLAVATTYKIAVAAPFVGFAIPFRARERWFRNGLVVVLASTVAPLAYFAWRIAVDGPANVRIIWGEVLGAVTTGTSDRARVFVSAFFNAPLTCAFLLLGAVGLALGRGGDPRVVRRQRVYLLLAAAFVATYIALNPYQFPYNFVIFMPFIAPLVIGLEHLVTNERLRTMVLFLVPLSAVIGGLNGTYQNLAYPKGPQERVIRWVWQTTPKTDAVYDWQGVAFGRRGPFHWWTFSGLVPKYRAGWYSVAEEVRRSQVSLILLNYRLNYWTARDRAWIERHFVWVDTCLLTPGWTFEGEELRRGKVVEAFLRNGVYLAQPANVPVLIDGKPVAKFQNISAGPHLVSVAPSAQPPAHFALFYMPAERYATTPPCEGQPLIAWYN